MGAIGGSIWHSVKGARNSPRGARLAGAIDAVKIRAPVLGGNFAVWGGQLCFRLFSWETARVPQLSELS